MSLFGTTQWPDRRLRVPSVLATRVTVVEGGMLAYSTRDEDRHSVELPDEFFLRELMDLDVRDLGEFVRFQQNYGRLASERHLAGIIPITYEVMGVRADSVPIPTALSEQMQSQP